jgi:Fic family protein
MKVPQQPPALDELMSELNAPQDLLKILSQATPHRDYLHWDKLRYKPAPGGINHRQWWLATKLSRAESLKPINLTDTTNKQFQFSTPNQILQELHQIDLSSGGSISAPEQITNPQTRDRYLISSIIEEAITSSQLEGAATTRDVAKEMIRSGRHPRDTSERMILNNYYTMQRIRELKTAPLTPEIVFEIHRLVTDQTLDDNTAAGRFRNDDEERVVGDMYGEVFHTPPTAEQLEARMQQMCDFANENNSDDFIHPVIRAIILHFWLAYDHPFVDGNGRTARALFYWAMLHYDYWLFEFISISNIIRKAPVKYGRSFLYTETDDNDLTYFIVAQVEVIRRAITELHAYIERKTNEVIEVEKHLRALQQFNHRQVGLLSHALKHPGHIYTFSSHQKSNGITYQTARTDLLDIAGHDLLLKGQRKKQIIFSAPSDLSNRLLELDK